MLELVYSLPSFGSLDSLAGEALELRGPSLRLHTGGDQSDGGHLDREGVLWVAERRQERVTVKVIDRPDGGLLWARGGERRDHLVGEDSHGFFLEKLPDQDLRLLGSDRRVLASYALDGAKSYWTLADGQKLNAIWLFEPVPAGLLLLPAEPLGPRSRLSTLAE